MDNVHSNTPKKATLIIGISLALGVCFDLFFYEKMPGIGFPIYILLITLGLFLTSIYFGKQMNKDVLWLLIPLGFFSMMVFVRASILLSFLNIVASLLILLIIARVSIAEKIKNFSVDEYIKVFFVPFKIILPFFRTISDLFSTRRFKLDKVGTWSPVVKGIIMAIPVLILFILLFSSADLIFQKFISNLFDIDLNINPETVFRLILIALSASAFIGAYTYAFREPHEDTVGANHKFPAVGHVETSIILGSVNVLFLAFVLVQLTYLFGGESNISSQGFTYAEYARKGFFELIAVAIISFLLLWITERDITKKEAEHSMLFKILSGALVVQVLLIINSAFIRLMLYEEAYGFTILRFYSHAFTILLALIFCLLLYKIYRDKRENTFAFRIFMSITLFLIVMNLINPEAFVAKQNIDRFATTGKLDVNYLSRLSEDAIPASMKVLEISDESLRGNFGHELYLRASRPSSSQTSQWQSMNISRIKAEEILKSRIEELEQFKDYRSDNSTLESD